MEIYISSTEWEKLNNNFSKEDIIEAFITEIVDNRSIRIPLRIISREEAISSYERLTSYEPAKFVEGQVFTRYDYAYELSNRYLNTPNTYNPASDHFHQKNRFRCDSINAPSPCRTWKSRKFLSTMLPVLWSLKFKEITMDSLRTALSLRKYVASQFKPSMDKAIYTEFNSVDVLDFSSGWGDRLCGFYATEGTRSYIGIDPNSRLHPSYAEQIKAYRNVSGEKKVEMHCATAETIELKAECVDTVFTSPPYFNIERYSEEATQSYKKYKKLDDWLELFLYKSLSTAWSALKPEGHMIINISDVYSNHTVNKICDNMNSYIEHQLGGSYVGGLGMQMSQRPNSGAVKNKEGVFVEPLWVWSKN